MNNIMTIVKKEFTDILRDRKTLLMTVVIPIVIMPLIFVFIFQSVSETSIPSSENKYAIAIDTDSKTISQLFANIEELKLVDVSGDEAIDQAYKGDILVYAKVEDNFESLIQNNQNPTIELYYDTTSQKAETAIQVIQNVFSSYQNSYVSTLLAQNGLPENALAPYKFVTHARDESVDSISTMLLGMMIPMMLIGYSANGITPIAVDLGAGEKERGTLEPLLSTSASRTSILIAKLIVTSFFGVLTSVLSAVGLLVAFKYGMPDVLAIQFNFSIEHILIMLLLSILYAIFLSAILLLISTYARSNKEANTYLTPCVMIPILLSMVTMYMDVNEISFMMVNIPILNVVSVIKEIVVNQLNYTHLYITIGWSIAYIIISVIIAKTLYNKEEIVFRA